MLCLLILIRGMSSLCYVEFAKTVLCAFLCACVLLRLLAGALRILCAACIGHPPATQAGRRPKVDGDESATLKQIPPESCLTSTTVRHDPDLCCAHERG